MNQISLLCSVYRTRSKEGMYLYVPKADDFSQIPEALMKRFGNPILVMHIPKHTNKTLHSVSPEALSEAFERDGFYLQMPPKQENWLAEHRVELGLSPEPPKEER